MSGLRQKPLWWVQLVSNGMLFTYSLSCRITIRLGEKVFTYQPLDMTCVPWHLLVSNHVVWTACPILRKSTLVSKNLLVFVYVRGILITVKTTGLRSFGIQSDRVLSSVVKNFSLDLSSGRSKSLVFAWNMTRIAREIFLAIIRWSCKSSHFNFNLFINLNYFILKQLKGSYNS